MAGGLAAAKEAGFRNNAVVDSQRLGRLPHRNMFGVFGECSMNSLGYRLWVTVRPGWKNCWGELRGPLSQSLPHPENYLFRALIYSISSTLKNCT